MIIFTTAWKAHIFITAHITIPRKIEEGRFILMPIIKARSNIHRLIYPMILISKPAKIGFNIYSTLRYIKLSNVKTHYANADFVQSTIK